MKKRILAGLMTLIIIVALLPAIAPIEVRADTDAFGLPLDYSWQRPPLVNNPYGTAGWVNLFAVNEFYMAKGSGGTRSTTIRDTTPDFTANTTNLYSGGIMNIGSQYSNTSDASNIAFAASVAFDPTGCGQKNHVANIGYNVGGYMTVWITNDKGSTLASSNIGTSNSGSYSHMTELSGYNFDGYIQITAGDYDGDGKETIMVYDPAMPKTDNPASSRPRVREYSFSGTSLAASGRTFDPGPELNANGKYDAVIKEHNKSDSYRLRATPTAHLVSDDIDKDGRDELVATYSFQDLPNAKYDSVTITERAVVTAIYEQKISDNAWQTTQTFVMQDNGNNGDRGAANRIRTSGAAAIGNFTPTERGPNWPQIVVAGTWDEKGGATSSTASGKWGYGVIYCTEVDTSGNGIGKYSLDGLLQVDQNGFTKGGIYTNDSVKPLAPVVGFKASGAAGGASLFLSGTVYSVESTGLQAQWTNSYFTSRDRGITDSIISNAHIIKPVAGNFDGNEEGREQVVFISLYKRESLNQYFWRLFTAGSPSTNKDDGSENWKLATKGGVTDKGALNNSTGNFELYKESAGSGKNWISIAALDTKSDARLGKIKEITREYTEPTVLTIFESAPYFADLDSISPDYYTSGGTYYGKTRGSGTSSSFSKMFHANIIVGYEYEDPISKTGVDIEATFSNDFTWETETSESIEFGIGYTNTPGQNSVLVCRRPVIIYEYDGLRADGNGGYTSASFILGMQQKPVTGLLSIEEYNKAAPKFELDLIDESVISSIPGEPSTYRHSIAGLKKLVYDTEASPIPFSGYGTTEMTIEQGNSTTKSYTYEFNADLRLVGKVCGFKAGVSVGGGFGDGRSSVDFTGTSMGGAVVGRPSGAEEYNFNWLFASWATEINGQEVPVLGYIVSECSAPPSAPVNLSIADIKSDSLTLQWEHGLSGAEKYAIYRYVENDPIPERLLAIVSGANTEYLFNTDVKPETTYSFVIRAISSMGTSVRSAVATATTLPVGAGVMNVTGPNDVSVNIGGTASFEVAVTGIPKEYLSSLYQWEKRTKDTGWQKVGGVSNSPKTTVTNVTKEIDNSQYRCVILATKGDGSLVYFYSRTATLSVGLADSKAALTLSGAQGGGPGTTRHDPYYGAASYQQEVITKTTVTDYVPVTVMHSGVNLSLYQVAATRDASGEPLTYEDYYIGIGYDINNAVQYYKVTKGTEDNFSNAKFVKWTVTSSQYRDSLDKELYDGELDMFISKNNGTEYDTYLKIAGDWNDTMPTPDNDGYYDFTGVGLLESATDYTLYYGRFSDPGNSASYTYYDSVFNQVTITENEIASLYTVFDMEESTDRDEKTTQTSDDPPVETVTVTETTTTKLMVGRQEGYDFTIGTDAEQYTASFFQPYQLIKTYTETSIDGGAPQQKTEYTVTPAYYVEVNEFMDENSTGTGKTASDITSLTIATQRENEEISYVNKEGKQIDFAATIKDATSGSPISGTNVTFSITNTRTGVVSTIDATTGTNGTAAITGWRAPNLGLYSIVATSSQTAVNKLAQSDPLYYLAMPSESKQYVLQLTNSAGEAANTITYGSSVTFAVEEYTIAGSVVETRPYNGPKYYKAEYVDYNGELKTNDMGTDSSFMPPQAGDFMIIALDAPNGNVLATAVLTVLRRPVTIGVTDDIPNTKPRLLVKSGSLVGGDAYSYDDFIDVSCSLYDDTTGEKQDVTGTFPVAIFYKMSLDAAATQQKTEMLAKYSVSFDQRTAYTIVPNQILVYYTSGENGSVSGRQTDANLKFNSGSSIELGTRLMFEAQVNTGFGVKEWSINGNVITGSTAAYTLSPDHNILTINQVAATDAQNGVLNVNVAFKSTSCLINFGAGSGGRVSAKTAGSGNNLTTGTHITNGATVILTAVPDTSNVVGVWTVNDETVYWSGTNIPYREKTLDIENVQIDYTINVSFETDKKHTITTSAYNEDGHPSSSVHISAKAYNGDSLDLASVSDGASIVFTAENLIADNQIVKKWQVKKEGSSVFSDILGSGGEVTCAYYSVDSDFEIRAIIGTSQEFYLQYSIVDNNDESVADADISAASAGSQLSTGANTGFISVEFTASYDAYYYQVYNWILNGIEQNITDDIFVLDSLDKDVTVKAILIKKPVVTVSTAVNGDIYDEEESTSIAGTVYTIPYGTTDPMKFIAAPDYGYEVEGFYVGGTALTGIPVSGDTLEFTYTPPTGGAVSDISVIATFAAIPTYDIEYAVFDAGNGFNGEIEVEISRKGMTSYFQKITKSDGGDITVFRDSEVSFISVAESDYVLQNWVINGTNTDIAAHVLTKTITDDSIQIVEAQFTSRFGKLIFGTDGNGLVETVKQGTTISIENGANIESDFDAEFKATPNYGYKLLHWEVDDEIDDDTSNTLTKLATTDGLKVIAYFEGLPYNITFSAEGCGTISAFSGSDIIESGAVMKFGENVQFIAIPDLNYVFDGFYLNEIKVTDVTAYTAAVSGDMDVVAKFLPGDNTVSYSAGTGGSVSAALEKVDFATGSTAKTGQQIIFTAKPNAGYKVNAWKVNNIVVSGEKGNTFAMTVAGDASVSVEFIKTHFEVTFSVSGDANGTISATVDGKAIQSGDMIATDKIVIFTATPDSDYMPDVWTIDGVSQTTDVDTQRIKITSDTDTTVSFTLIPSYELTFSSMGRGAGKIKVNDDDPSLSGKLSVKKYDKITFSAIPDNEYNAFGKWYVDSVEYTGDGDTLTIDGFDKDTTVEAMFVVLVSYDVAFSAGTGGTISAKANDIEITHPAGGNVKVPGNSKIVFTATPEPDMVVKEWKVNGVIQEGNLSNVFIIDALSGNSTVEVDFEPYDETKYICLTTIYDDSEVSVDVTSLPDPKNPDTKIRVGYGLKVEITPKDSYMITTFVIDTTTGTTTVNVNADGSLSVSEGGEDSTLENLTYDIQSGKLIYDVASVPNEGDITINIKARGYVLTIVPATNGTINASINGVAITSSTAVKKDTEVTLTATASAGYKFSSWNKVGAGTLATTDANTVFKMPNGDVTIGASFVKIPNGYVLTIEPATNGVITASINGAAITSGSIVNEGTQVTLTATANAGYEFSSWSKVGEGSFTSTSANTIFTMPAGAVTIGASFTPTGSDSGYVLTIAPANNGTITASINGTAITNGSVVKEGTQVALTATANAGYKFSSWSKVGEGSFTSTSANTIFTMPAGAVTISADFTSTSGGGGYRGGGGGDRSDSGNGVVATIPDEMTPLGESTEKHIQYIGGYPNGSVGPDNAITRAEMCAILFHLQTSEAKNQPLEAKFPDVSKEAWYYQAVTYLASIGIISGYPNGNFNPDSPITRAEFATMVSQFGQLEPGGSAAFPDIIGHWAEAFIQSAANKSWVSGYPDGTFKPDNRLTRAEAITVINRMLNRGIESSDLPEWAPKYTDLEATHWAYAEIMEASIGHRLERKENGKEIWIKE